MDAFRAALQVADGIECDFRLGEDGELFVMHDQELSGYPAEKLSREERARFSLPSVEEVWELQEEFPEKVFLFEAKTLLAGREFLRRYQSREKTVLISFVDQVIYEADGWERVLLETASPDVLRDRMPSGARPGPSGALARQLSPEEIGRSYIWVVNDPEAAGELEGAWAIGSDCIQDLVRSRQ